MLDRKSFVLLLQGVIYNEPYLDNVFVISKSLSLSQMMLTKHCHGHEVGINTTYGMLYVIWSALTSCPIFVRVRIQEL